MIGLLGLVLAVQTAQDATLERDPGIVISKVFLKYYNAKTLSGTIVQETNEVGGGKIKITTKINYERPSKVSIVQDYVGRNGLPLTLVSDGVKFAYDPPWDIVVQPKPRERLTELVTIHNAGTSRMFVHGVGEMYHAAHKSLMPSTILDLAVAFKSHLNDFKINVRTYALAGMVTVNGKNAYKITGAWQPYTGATDVQMRFELYVSTEFDVLRFAMTQPILVNGKPIQVTTVENADLKVDVPVHASLFVVR